MELYTSLSFALIHSEGSGELVRQTLSRALKVAATQGDSAYELRPLSGLFMYYGWNTDINAALDVASRSKEVTVVLPVYLTLADFSRSGQYIMQLTELAAAHSLKPYQAIATGLRDQWVLLQNDLREGLHC